MDKAVRPQDDLFRFVNGTWLANTPFPPEYPSAGNSVMLFEKAQADVQAILLEDRGKLGDMYASFMDEATVESRGIEPLKPLFAEIDAIDGPTALARYFGRAQGRGISTPLSVLVYPDARNSTHNIAYVDQDGLGHAEPRLLPQGRRHLRRVPEEVRRLPREAADARGRVRRAGARGADPRARDEARDRPVDAGRGPRPGQDLQPARPGVGGEARARVRLEHLVRGHRPAGRRLRDPPAELRDGARRPPACGRPRGLEGLPEGAHDRRLRARAAGGVRRGFVRLQLADAARHRVAAPALEARRAGDRQRDGRGDRRGLRRAPLPAGSQGAHGRRWSTTCSPSSTAASTSSTG